MKNIPVFLRQRELGCASSKYSKVKEDTNQFLETRAANAEINQPCELSGQCRATFLMDFSPDGTKAASTHGDHTVRVTDLSTGKCTHILPGHPRTPWCLSFHPSSDQILASGCLGGEVRIWDLHGGGSEVWQCKDNLVVASLTFHPTDHVLVFAVGNKIYFWDWNQPEPFACCQTRYDYERIRLVRFDSLGQYLYTGIANNTMVQSGSSSRVSFMNSRSNPVPTQTQRPPRLSHVYNNLVDCFQAYQRDRVMNETSTGQSSDSDTSSDSTRRAGRRSPVHEEALNYARQYAAHVTASRPSVSGTQSHLAFSDDSVNRVHIPYAWSPPPREATEEDISVIVQDGSPTETEPEVNNNRLDGAAGFSPSAGVITGIRSSRAEISQNRSPDQTLHFGTLITLGSETSDTSEDTSPQDDVEIVAIGNDTFNIPDSPGTRASGINSAERDSISALMQLSSNHQQSTDSSSNDGLLTRDHDPMISSVNSETSSNRYHRNRRFTNIPTYLQRGGTQRLHVARRPRPVLQRDNITVLGMGGDYDCLDNNCEVCRNVTSLQSHAARRRRPYMLPPSRLHSRLSNCGASNSRSAFTQMCFGSEASANSSTHSARSSSSPEEAANRMIFDSETNQSQTVIHASDQSDPLTQSEDVSDTGDAALTDSSDNISSRGYEAIQNNFATITARIQREMNELDRRITALRNSFHESIQRLQQDRDMLPPNSGGNPGSEASRFSAVTPPAPTTTSANMPVITITRCRDRQQQRSAVPQPTVQDETRTRSSRTPGSDHIHHLLETPLGRSGSRSTESRSRFARYVARDSTPASSLPSAHHHHHNLDSQIPGPAASNNPHWRSLQRHHLHPHYSVSILDDTINRPNDAVQNVINRAIAGAFMGRGEPAVASNIINQTHRIQVWDFKDCRIPEITDASVNVIVRHCKLHNEASCDISKDRRLLATFVPSHRGFPDDNILAVFSIEPETRGQCFYTKSFGPNAISVSLSPLNNMVMVGLAAKRLSWVFTSSQLIGQIYKLENKLKGEKSMKHVSDVMHPCDMDIRSHVSVNSAKWLPGVGCGIIYGTNRGDLHTCRPGAKKAMEKESHLEQNSAGTSIRRNLMHMLGLSSSPHISIGTQTSARRSAGTQTETAEV